MLPPEGESDRFLTTMDLKLVGYRRGIFVFCYVVGIRVFWSRFAKPAVQAKRGEFNERAQIYGRCMAKGWLLSIFLVNGCAS